MRQHAVGWLGKSHSMLEELPHTRLGYQRGWPPKIKGWLVKPGTASYPWQPPSQSAHSVWLPQICQANPIRWVSNVNLYRN